MSCNTYVEPVLELIVAVDRVWLIQEDEEEDMIIITYIYMLA